MADIQSIAANTDGTFSTVTNTAVNVTTATTTILAANASRKYAVIVNDSDTVIYLKLAASAALNSGIRLNASGGFYEITPLNRYVGIITGIHGGSGNKVVTVIEGV